MSIAVQCPGCSSRLSAPDSAAGKTVKCPKCGNSITIPAAQPGAAFEVVDEQPAPAAKKPASAKPAAAKARAVVVDEDEKPRKKAKAVVEEEEEEKSPRKKAKAVVDDEEDEEEAPRKKKGKKGKKAGTSPAMLYGGIAAGVLLLAGVSFAVYWFGIREKPPETANTGGTGTPPRPGTPGPITPGEKPPGWESPATAKFITRNWKEFTAAEHGFKATYPWYAPPTSPWAQPPEGVTKAARFEVQYSEPGGILTFFTVIAIQLKPGTAADHNKTVDKLIELLYLSPDLKPSAPKQVTLGGKPATEVVYEMAQPDAKGKKSRIVMRRLVTDTTAYLVYVHEHGRIQPEDFATFFDSFALTK